MASFLSACLHDNLHAYIHTHTHTRKPFYIDLLHKFQFRPTLLANKASARQSKLSAKRHFIFVICRRHRYCRCPYFCRHRFRCFPAYLFGVHVQPLDALHNVVFQASVCVCVLILLRKETGSCRMWHEY